MKRKQSFLDKHGRQIGAALCGLSALLMVGLMSLLFVLAAPGWIELKDQVAERIVQVEIVR